MDTRHRSEIVTTRNDSGHLSSERLQAFLEGELSKRDRSLVEEHLQACARCSAEFGAWEGLFADLGTLAALSPHEGFETRVMAGVRIPEPLSLSARMKDRAADLLGLGASGHLDTELAHALVDGELPRRGAARVRRHLESCAPCSHEVEGWTTLSRRLRDLPDFGPSAAFADQVMARVAHPEAVRALTPARAASAASPMGWLGRVGAVLPKSRRVWAALSGAAVTPVVTLGMVLWVVLSNPAVTPGALAAYASWQLTDLAAAAWSTGVAGLANAVAALGLAELFGAAAASTPALIVAAATVYSVLALLAGRVLYRNLVAGRPVGIRHAQISRS